MALRLRAMGHPKYANGFKVALHERALRTPLEWQSPRVIFVNSMSDLFHEAVPFSFIRRVFRVMAEADWHVFQVLTKRSERLGRMAPRLSWPDNVWMGVSVESEEYAFRVDDLLQTRAAVKFISLEPLLGQVSGLKIDGVDWLIAGGESGPGARAMDPNWVRDTRDRCTAAGVPFFFKQWGGVRRKEAGRTLDGRTWDEMPEVPPSLRRQQQDMVYRDAG